MNRSMITASVSMNALMRKLEVISNNMANMYTDGFKKQDVSFADLLTSVKQQHPKQNMPGRLSPAGTGITLGTGARVSEAQLNMKQGSLRLTDQPYDLAIEGDALFEVGLRTVDADGNETFRPSWTRNGAFHVSPQPGNPDVVLLVTDDGAPVYNSNNEPIELPAGRDVTIDENGRIWAAAVGDANAPPEQLGQLKLVRAVRPQLLVTYGDNRYVLPPSLDGRRDELIAPVDPEIEAIVNGRSTVAVRQRFLEGSNVNIAAEMTEMIQVQRAFQLNARALASSDTMMDLVNKLRG